MRTVFIVSLLLGVQVAIGQDFKERLIAIQEEYAGIEEAHIMMTIEVFEDEGSKTPYFKEVADIKRQSQNYHYKFGTMHMLMNTKCLVMVDKSAKEIVYTSRSPEDEEKFFQDPLTTNLDSILSLYGNPSYLGSENDGDHYRVMQKKGEIRQVDIFIDSVSNRLNRIEYRYIDSHYVAIVFTLFEKQPFFEPDTFSEDQYVIEEKGSIRSSREFQGYRVAAVGGG